MIIRRYGNRFHSVSIDFDPAAMTEVGFRRDGEQEWDTEEFMSQHELIREEEIIAESSDVVQEKAEREMLVAKQAAAYQAERGMWFNDKIGQKELLRYHYNLALIYDRSHQCEQAVVEYKKALELAPDDADVHYNLGIVYDECIKDKEKAIFHYQKYLELCPYALDARMVADWIIWANEDLEWEEKLR